MDITENTNIFVNRYHLKCKYTKLSYCTCINGARDFYYSTNNELNSMFDQILPSTNISTLIKLLSDSSNANDHNVQIYKNIEKMVSYEREKYNEEYKKKVKKIKSDMMKQNVSELSDNLQSNSKNYKLISIASPDIKCCVDNCTKKDDHENLFECNICRKGYHSTCCYPPITTSIKHSFPWICTECSYCTICKGNEEQNLQVICDICNRYFHINCLNPKLTKVPKTFWSCNDCSICSRCSQNIKFPIKNNNIDIENIQDEFEYIDMKYGTRICLDCKDKNEILVCNVCNKELDKQGNRICSHCRLAVHNDCCREQICDLCNQ